MIKVNSAKQCSFGCINVTRQKSSVFLINDGTGSPSAASASAASASGPNRICHQVEPPLLIDGKNLLKQSEERASDEKEHLIKKEHLMKKSI